MTVEPYAPQLPATDSWVPVLAQVGELAQSIAGTDFVPKALRGKPAAVAACILLGRELGLPPMTALTGIYIVDGTPTLSSATMRALVYAAGHTITVDEWTDQKCTLAGYRRGEKVPVAVVTYSMADAQRAGLSGRGPWKAHPRSMLLARATSDLCRAAFPDTVAGLGLADDAHPTEEPTARTAVRRKAPSGPEERPVSDETVPGVAQVTLEPDNASETSSDPGRRASAPGPPQPHEKAADSQPQQDTITAKQLRMLHATLRDAGLSDRDTGLAAISTIIGRELDSTKNLTRDEASAVLDQLTGR